LIKGRGLAFLQVRENPMIAEKICHNRVFPQILFLSIDLGVFCVSQWEYTLLCSLKIAHHGAAERSRAGPCGKVTGFESGS